MNYQGKHILITGGSSGIGLALAKKLAAFGAHVWILARDPGKMAMACADIQQCRMNSSQKIGALTADVSDADQTAAVIKDHIAQNSPFDIVINCAGVTQPGMFIEMDLDIFRSMMEVNYFGILHVLKAVLPGMIARKSGHIVNVSSVAGFLGMYGYSAYGPSKFAVRGLSDSLRGELAEHGIGMSVVFPPDTQTPQLEYETPFKPPVLVQLDKSNKVLSAEAVANSIIKGVARGHYAITPGFDSTLYYLLTNFFGLVYPVMDFMVAQAHRAIRRANRTGTAEYNHRH
jgi:3-dehydrosphinganine reductase